MGLTKWAMLRWWLNKRLEFNMALLFTGLMGFVIQTVMQPFKHDAGPTITGLMSTMQLSGMGFGIFLIIANIAFTAGCVLDMLFNFQNSQSFRDRLFLIGYCFAIVALSLAVIFFLNIMELDPADSFETAI